MKRIVMAAGWLAVGAFALSGQEPRPKEELRSFAGAFVPTGGQRALFKSAAMVGAQGALEIDETMHMVGTFAWVPAHTKYPGADENVSIFTFDLGVEIGPTRPLANGRAFKPFFGLGVGGRSYNFKATTLSDRTCAAAYGSPGSELQMARIALRLEARENMYCYKSPIVGIESVTRYDLGLAFGLAYHFR